MKLDLKKLFKGLNIDENGKVDIDIDDDNDTPENKDDTSKTTLDDNNKKNNKNNDTIDNNKKGVDKAMSIKYDPGTGLFSGFKDIENEELKALFKLANDTVKSNKTKAIIDDAVKAKFGTYKVNKGITEELVTKLLDLSNVKVDDSGNVTGVDEAFKSLMTSNSGLFLSEKDKDNNSTAPQLEGYNKANSDDTPMSDEDIINLAYGTN